MPIILRSLAIAAALACAALAPPPPPRVEYTLTPVLQDGVLQAVQVDLRFRGLIGGETNLRLPNEWGGQRELYRSVDALQVISGATMQETESPARRVLTHARAARIHVRYRIIQDWQGDPNAEQGNPYRAIVRPTYFHFIGDAALVIPEIDGLSPVFIRTRNMPRRWSFASDLQHAGATIARADASISVGGDFRIVRSSTDPNIRVAIRGAWRFSDADFVAQVSQIVAGQRRFWGDASSSFLVTVVELAAPNQGWLSIGGTGLGDAFAFFATPNAEARPIARTLAHETLHTWIPGEIGGMPEEGEAISYWLSEGFTDFYTGRLLVRDGLWTPADFAAEFNQMLSEYARSPVQSEPNTRILADYWNDREVQRLPYQRGQMLAAIWNARMRASGARDFDDLVLEMRARARGGDPFDAVDMFPIVAVAMDLDVAGDIATHVDAGTPILLPEDVFAPCGRVTTRDVPIFDRGFDITATQANSNVIAGVDPALPAYAAGMRNGMVLLRRDGGEIGNAELEIGYVVRDGDGERTIRYMPRGRGSYTLQALVLETPLEGERLVQCQAVLGGG